VAGRAMDVGEGREAGGIGAAVSEGGGRSPAATPGSEEASPPLLERCIVGLGCRWLSGLCVAKRNRKSGICGSFRRLWTNAAGIADELSEAIYRYAASYDVSDGGVQIVAQRGAQ